MNGPRGVCPVRLKSGTNPVTVDVPADAGRVRVILPVKKADVEESKSPPRAG